MNAGDSSTPGPTPAGPTTRSALGPPAWSAVSPYSWWLALVATAVMLAVSVGMAALLSEPLARLFGLGSVTFGGPVSVDAPGAVSVPPGLAMAWLLVSQTVTSVLVLGAAGLYGADRRRLLSLGAFPSARVMVAVMAGLVLILAPYNAVVFALTPQSAIQDLQPFSRLMHSDVWWLTALVVAVGAPVSEELLFRGFLLPALAQSRLGFRGGAIVSTALWALLHTGYSLAGLLEVTVIGLYFCWVVWRWGNLWAAIFAHALYNGLLITLLSLVRL